MSAIYLVPSSNTLSNIPCKHWMWGRQSWPSHLVARPKRRGLQRRLALSGDISASNLGQLGRFASQGQLSADDAAMMLQRTDPTSFADQGLYIDGGSFFASGVLLAVLLAFSTNRIFGLDRFLLDAARNRKEQQKKEQVEMLQRMLDTNDSSSDTDPTSGEPPNPTN